MLFEFLKAIAGAELTILTGGGEPRESLLVLVLYYLAACAGGFLLFHLLAVKLRASPSALRKAAWPAFLFALGLSAGFEHHFAFREAFCSALGLLPRADGLPAAFSAAAFVLAWYAAVFPLHAAADRNASVPARFRFFLRLTAVPFALIFFLCLVEESVRRLPLKWLGALARLPLGLAFPEFLALVLVALFIPLLTALLWGARPLEDPFLLPRLRRIALRAGLPSLRILLWPTAGARYHNALTMGLVRPLSFVMMSDAIVEDFPPPYAEAIFAHEAAHASRRHLLLFLLGMAGAAGLVLGVALSLPGDLSASIAGLGALSAYVLLVVGPLMRNAEREADLTGAALLDDPLDMARALEYLKNFVPPGKWKRSFTHFGLDERVTVAERCALDASERRRLLSLSRRRIRAALAAALLALVFGIWALSEHSDEISLEQWVALYWTAVERDSPREGLSFLSRALEVKEDPEIRMLYGLTCLDLGMVEEAAEVLRGTKGGGKFRKILERELRKAKREKRSGP